MVRALVVCEGQTEETFVGQVLAPFVAPRGIGVSARLFETSPGHAGGGLGRAIVLGTLCDALRERDDLYLTTLFDLFGLPKRFPGLSEASRENDPLERARRVEEGLHRRVVADSGCSPERFFPHVQPYEFESLLFADAGRFAEVNPAWADGAESLRSVAAAAATPEHINDGDGTQPSKRLAVLHRYRKTLHGVEVASRIGVERIRQECRHFDGWVSRLESLPPLEGSG